MGSGTRMQTAAGSGLSAECLANASDVQPGYMMVSQAKSYVFVAFKDPSAGKNMRASSPAEYLAHQIGGAVFGNTNTSYAKSHQAALDRSKLPAPNDAGSRKTEEIISKAKRYSGTSQLLYVHNAWNETIQYTTDMKAWGKLDYQADARESAANKKGDCDDYAFAKAYTLTQAGYPPDRVFTITFKEGYGLNGKKYPAHTVCAVVDEKDRIYVLDNRNKGLRTLDQTLATCGPCAGICSMEERMVKTAMPATAAVSSEAPSYLASAGAQIAQARAQQEQGSRLSMGA